MLCKLLFSSKPQVPQMELTVISVFQDIDSNVPNTSNGESSIYYHIYDYHFLIWPLGLSFWFRKVTFLGLHIECSQHAWMHCKMCEFSRVLLNILGPFGNWKEPQLHSHAACRDAVECADYTHCAVRLPSLPYINCAEENIDPLGWVAFGYHCTLSSILVSFPKWTSQSFMW